MLIKKSFNILIVEDEFLSAQFIAEEITKLGHNVIDCVSNAKDAIDVVEKSSIDLVLMDINIEGTIDGIECSFLLNRKESIPIIYITAYNDTETIESASDSNIYGYLIKPFDRYDLIATLNVAAKRISKTKSSDDKSLKKEDTITLYNSYIYNIKNRTLSTKGAIIQLTKKESAILYLFCTNLNQNISYELLLEHVWGGKEIVYSTIRDTILRLRKKAPLLNIINSSGIGYCLCV